MTTNALCPACEAWSAAADDAFCGLCGFPCARIGLDLTATVIQAGEVSPRATLTLANPSCANLRIERVVRPDWVKAPDLRPGVELAAGSRLAMRVDFQAFQLSESALADIVVESNLGRRSVELLAIAPEPALRFVPEVVEIWGSRQGRRTVSFELSSVNSYLRILEILDPGHHWLSLRCEPGRLEPRRGMPCEIMIDVEALTASLGPDTVRPIGIPVVYQGPHGLRTLMVPLRFEMREPPQLNWIGRNDRPQSLLQTSDQQVICRVSNRAEKDYAGGRANARLTIEKADLTVGGASGLARLQTLLPLDLPGGDTGMLAFSLDAEKFPAGLQTVEVRVESNAGSQAATFSIPIDVRELHEFDGMLAIDFGTSNTCCAAIEEGHMEPTDIAIDGTDTTSPTVVRYLDLSGQRPEIETGATVKYLAAVDEAVAAGTVSRLKQLLGETAHPLSVRPMRSESWVHRDARDASADYLRHVRTIAERSMGVRFRRFVLTHPAVCSLAQYRNLRQALLQAFGQEARMLFLQEPIAALIPFIEERARVGGSGYSVAAFDLGGGTTDVTVVQVSHSQLGASLEINPAIVTSWGERFGGEDLTDFLVDEVRTRCQAILDSRGLDQRLVDRNTPGVSTADFLRNQNELRRWAEAFKARQSDKPGPEPGNVTLRCVTGNAWDGPLDSVIQGSAVLAAGRNLQDVFQEWFRAWIDYLAGRLETSCRVLPQLDFIQLSGKTALLPAVREVLKERMPSTEIVRASEPKQCVVRGACLARALSRNGSRRLVLGSTTRTTSSIGLLDPGSQQFKAVLRMDQPIPNEGLTCDLAGGWQGEDTVVLWENLGIDNQYRWPDGTVNNRISKLGTWELPDGAPIGGGLGGLLRVHLARDFTLQVSVVTAGGQEVSMKPRVSGGIAAAAAKGR